MEKYSLYSSRNYRLDSNIEDEEVKDQCYCSANELPREESSSGWTEILAGYSDYARKLDLKEGERKSQEKEEDAEMIGGTTVGDDDDDCLSYDVMMRSDSMVSDAGSGPEWRRRMISTCYNYKLHNNSSCNNNNNNNSAGLLGGEMPPNTLRKLDFNKSKRISKEIPYDDSLEDTASSPVNSPKITMVLKRMDLSARRTNENFEGYNHEKLGGNDHHRDHENHVTSMQTDGAQEQGQRQINTAGTIKEKIDNWNVEDFNELEKKGLCLVPVSMLLANYMN